MKRKSDWQAALAGTVRARRELAFAYGDHDCCMAAASCIEAMTDIDLMADFRGSYKSAAGANRILRERGKGTLLKTLLSLVPLHGGKRIPVARARKGDLVVTKKALHDEAQGQAAGVWLDSGAIFPGEKGWVQLPRTDLVAAFRIG